MLQNLNDPSRQLADQFTKEQYQKFMAHAAEVAKNPDMQLYIFIYPEK